MARLLLWLERGLLAIGVALAVWCAVVLAEAQYTKNLPIPDKLVITQTLPGDADSGAPARAPAPAHTTAPAPGTWVARLSAPSVDMTATVLEGSDVGTLNRGAGHIEDTPFPGQPGNIG